MRAVRALLRHPLLVVICLGLLVELGALACGGGPDEEEPAGRVLCSGTNCQNASGCPSNEPSNGAACTDAQYGNCHYCEEGSTSANGYSCYGSSWEAQGTFSCDG